MFPDARSAQVQVESELKLARGGRGTDLVTLPALLASEAAVGEPLDTDSVSNLEVRLGVLADRSDVARALVSSDERELVLVVVTGEREE